jgi:hypothetical protein
VILIMTSWQLLRDLLGFWRATNNPIFWRTIQRPPVWYKIYQRAKEATGVMLVLGGLGCYSLTLVIFLFNNLLILIAPLLIVWTLLIGMTLGPVIVHERIQGTWTLLRITPLDTHTLLLGKASGALWWLRDIVRAMTGLLWLVAIGVGLVSMILTPTYGGLFDNNDASLLCLAAFVVPVVCAGVYAADRAQQFALMVAVALGVSASARSVRMSLTGASAGTFGIWLLDVSLAASVVAVNPTHAPISAGDWLALAILGPVVGYVAVLPLLHAALVIGATLLVREVAIRALWRWTVHQSTI